MASITEDYLTNHNAFTASTKGAAPGNQIMWAAALLTIFQRLETWIKSKPE